MTLLQQFKDTKGESEGVNYYVSQIEALLEIKLVKLLCTDSQNTEKSHSKKPLKEQYKQPEISKDNSHNKSHIPKIFNRNLKISLI